MPLNSGGRVVLKVYNSKGQLLISKPCPSKVFAATWLEKYTKGKEETYTSSITEMVPRI